jgi:hypothetical protein
MKVCEDNPFLPVTLQLVVVVVGREAEGAVETNSNQVPLRLVGNLATKDRGMTMAMLSNLRSLP